MRRLPIVGLAISVLLVPVAASATVPDAALKRDLVGGSGPATVATAIGDVTGDGVPDLIVARGADAGPDAYTVAVFDGPLSDPLPTDPSFVVTPSASDVSTRCDAASIESFTSRVRPPSASAAPSARKLVVST